MALRPAMHLNQAQDFLAQSLAPFGIGQGGKEFLPGQALHPVEDFLNRAPIRDSLLEPLILFFGQGDANGFAFDLAGPGVTSPASTQTSVLDIAFADPAGEGQLRLQMGVLPLAGGGRWVVSIHE